MEATPTVSAFRGLTYSLDRYGSPEIHPRIRLDAEEAHHAGRVADVTDVVCPPFDVMTDEDRTRLLERNDRNAARLELNPAPDPYRAAADELARWRSDRTLAVDREPRVYYYVHATSSHPDRPSVHGVVVRVLLEPWGARVRPHERTLHGPKQDRLALLRSTTTQFSPILAIYFDRSQRYAHVMSRPWSDEWRARDGDGLLHQLAAVEPDPRLIGYLGRQQLFVADGHHRYETALAYRDEVRALPLRRGGAPGALAADWVMAVLVNAAIEDVEIRPTHRLVRGVDRDTIDALHERLAACWEIQPVAPSAVTAELAALARETRPVVAMALPGDRTYVLLGRREQLEARMRHEPTSTAARRLDLAALHATVLRDILGIDVAREAAGDRLAYTKDAADALSRVTHGDVDAAFLVRPTPLDQLAAVARAGDVMPQKSTYFHPKLLTGLVFNPLED
ncbi:MAG: DUF1015 family protein [Candidatus Limnocylindria bacterium]